MAHHDHPTIQDEQIADIAIASMMVCSQPKQTQSRLILSGYDGVWEAIEKLPDDLKPYFTDDIGNKDVEYGGFLQLVDVNVLELINNQGLFACFRGIQKQFLEHVNAYPPEGIYTNLVNKLKFMGWDISTGNGWRSASCDGYFPLDPFTGEARDENISQLNKYSLFSLDKHCLEYCEINNKELPDYSPWYPVAIYVDKNSYNRLNSIVSGLQ